MVSFADAFRPYWAYGLNNINVVGRDNFAKWIERARDFQVLAQVQPKLFQLTSRERKIFLEPISFDCNRFALSCFESVIKMEDSALLPKSLSWLLIKTYYSAFYASHLILRLLGYSLSQLDRNTINSVEKIADLYGYKNGINIEKGFYLCDFSSRNPNILFSKLDVGIDEGSHGAMWKFLTDKLTFISNDILTQNTDIEYQPISLKLSQLVVNLKYMGATSGTWLSKMRNDINYKHLYGTWYPYKPYEKYYSQIFKLIDSWKNDPIEIELNNLVGQELIRFFSSCQFLIGIAREISLDMNKRCSIGRSFHYYGSISLLNHVRIPVP